MVRNDLCIACGACIPACPRDNVRPAYHPGRAAHEVAIIDATSCDGCPAPCDDVCPSVAVDFAELLGRPGETVDRSGDIRAMHLGWAEVHRDNGVSSSGGIVRALIEQALDSGQPVICLGKSEGKEYEPMIFRKREDLSRIPGSIYHGVSFVQAIPLLREVDRPCLLVSTPCQLEGILKFSQQCEPELRSKIALSVGLICGWMYSDHSLKAFAKFKRIEGEIIDAGYRGEDEAGMLKITTEEEGIQKFSRSVFGSMSEMIDYRASFSLPLNRLRCRSCENHVNVLADIAVGDAWLARHRGDKLSIIVVRTEAGERALSDLQAGGGVHLTPAEDGDLNESQSENLVFGTEARRLKRYMRKRSIKVPEADFGDDPDDGEARGFRYEFAMRRAVRAGRYRLYRMMYLGRFFGLKLRGKSPLEVARMVGRKLLGRKKSST